MKVILASSSPRRKEILKQINLEFEVIPSEFEEAPIEMEPNALAEHFAYMKAMDVYSKLDKNYGDEIYVIGSDTIVYCNIIMGKPKNDEDAYEMLRVLSNKEHHVISGLCVVHANSGRSITTHEITKVWFRELEDREIMNYVESGEPMDKAGAYAIQGIGSLFVDKIDGCYFNVVGLPISKLYKIMKEFDVNLL